MKNLFSISLLLFSATTLFSQSTTTSSITGKVLDVNTHEELIGASIFAVHLPTGTSYAIATELDGSFRINNMRVGGPYRITVLYTGYGELVQKNIYLRLGECHKFDCELSNFVTQLTTIEVVAKVGTAGENAGTSTQISAHDLTTLPTLNRDLKDFTRLTPQASSFGDGISFGGTNNRYNALYIDGAVNNDVFGLSSTGTNGGQTGISPFSIDIIDQVQVVLSPYDVSLGGFAGGGINAVTKSGSNNWEGSAYYFTQNEETAGETNGLLAKRLQETDPDFEATPLDEFTKTTYGASLGGRIKKDKAFFFVNAEIQKDETPAPFEFGTYNGSVTEGDLDILRASLIDNYNYDPGTFGNTSDQLDGLKLFGKVSINLNNENELTLRHQYTRAEQFNRNVSNSTAINFSNNGVFFPSKTHSSAVELNSRFGNDKSNNFIFGYTSVRDDRDPLGNDFPYIRIDDNGAAIRLGSDEFSTSNQLNSDVLSITDNFKIFKKNHTFTLGTHNEFYNIYNLFIRQNYGSYRFSSLESFLNGEQASTYNRSYSLVDELSGDGSRAAVEFKAMQLGFYAQDEWAVNNKFTLTYGLRLDIPMINSDPEEDKEFNQITLPLLQDHYDVANTVSAGKAPDGQLMFSPRFGFSYEFRNRANTILRGGAGIFTSRIPFVWPGAMFNNNGLTIGNVNQQSILGGVDFIADVQNQYTNPNFSVPSGQIDLFTSDFKYPQVFRGNLAINTKLPGGIETTFEGIFTKTLNNIVYTNINSAPSSSTNWTGGPDQREIYTRTSIDPTYSAVYVGSNTSEGSAYNLTASFAKRFLLGIRASVAYTYGEAMALNEGTSSQNSSQWRGQVNIDGRNNPVFGRSDYATRHRIISTLSKKFNWARKDKIVTTVSLFYNGQVGNPYSYVYSGGNGNINNETGSANQNRSLVWIPASLSEINLVDYTNGGEVITAAEQWDQLSNFIDDDPYLSQHRGSYAEKNSSFLPFMSMIDLAFRQSFGFKKGGKFHKIECSLDIFNFGNMLNSDWGVQYFVPGDFNNYYLLNFEGYESDGSSPKFTYRNGDTIGTDNLSISENNSRWRMRLGLRYSFE